jgi:hypothetical protein
MARLPQQYAPLVYGIIQAAITTAVATAIATHQLTDFNMRFAQEWLVAWGISFLTMLPVVIFVAPFIQRCVLAVCIKNLIRFECLTESLNVSDDDRTAMLLSDAVGLAVQVEEAA